MALRQDKVFFPNLDGLRFFCFLSVFFFHSFATKYTYIEESQLYHFVKKFLAGNGSLGVNFFFVLSGFLITYLLFSEKEKYKRISVKNFYIRRILRIWPLFYFCIFFGFVIFPILKQSFGEVPNETANPWYYFFFLSNFDLIKHGLPDSSVLGILWSVAIEEQFYLVWPVLIAITPRKYTKYLFLAIIVLTFLFRLNYYRFNDMLENHTFSCISDMAVGGLFAYFSFFSKNFLRAIEKLSTKYWIALYLMVLAIFLCRKEIFHHGAFLIAFDRLFISVLFALIIVEQNYATKSFYKMGRFKLVSKLGVYTYGLYCLHMIGILIAAKGLAFLHLNTNVYQVIFLEGSLSLIFTIGLAIMSYHLFEKRFLTLKEKFALIKSSSTLRPEKTTQLDPVTAKKTDNLSQPIIP